MGYRRCHSWRCTFNMRLDVGTYGVYITCGGRRAAERLLVFPESGTCAQCGD
jgi:RNA polymerase-binding transcription factor DksA